MIVKILREKNVLVKGDKKVVSIINDVECANDNQWKIEYLDYIIAIKIVKDVDEAIRIMVYRNDEKTIYAKANKTTNEAEEGTETV